MQCATTRLCAALFACAVITTTMLGQNTPQTVIDDMTLAPDAPLHGTEGLDWGAGQAAPQPIPVPGQNWKGQPWRAMIAWGQVYIPREGSSAVNTRCQIRNVVTKLLKNDGVWYTVQTGEPEGAAFVENFANNAAIDAGARNESANGGGVSVIVGVGPWAGHNYHYWPTGGRNYVDVNTVIGVYTTCEARLIKDNPNGPDDRASCRNILQMGADWWLDMSGGWLPDWSANSGIGGGRSKWVTSEWQSFSFCSRTPSQITANPPIPHVVSSLINGAIYELEPQNALGKRLDVSGVSSADGAGLHIWDDVNGSNQRWKAIDAGSGWWELQPQHALGKRMDVNGALNANGTKVHQWQSNSGWAQRWKLISNGDGSYGLEPQCAPGQRLDVSGPSSANGTLVHIWSAHAGNNQKWKLLKQ